MPPPSGFGIIDSAQAPNVAQTQSVDDLVIAATQS